MNPHLSLLVTESGCEIPIANLSSVDVVDSDYRPTNLFSIVRKIK